MQKEMYKVKKREVKGFTLIEMLIVIAVIAILYNIISGRKPL